MRIQHLVQFIFPVFLLFLNSNSGLAKPDNSVAKPKMSLVLVDENVINLFTGEAEKQFQIAHRHFMDGDKKAAAQAMRKAAAFLKLELSRSTGQAKKALTAAVQSIERISVSVEKETLRSGQSLERVFADASHALAAHYNQLTKAGSQGAHEIKQTGRHLKAAATHLERGAYWAGSELKKTGPQAVQRARQLSVRLSQGKDSALLEVGKSVELLGKEIEKLGQKLKTIK